MEKFVSRIFSFEDIEHWCYYWLVTMTELEKPLPSEGCSYS